MCTLHVGVAAHACGGLSGCWQSSSVTVPPSSGRLVSPSSPELTNTVGSLAILLLLGTHAFAFRGWNYRWVTIPIYMGPGDLNSGPYSCRGNCSHHWAIFSASPTPLLFSVTTWTSTQSLKFLNDIRFNLYIIIYHSLNISICFKVFFF